MAHTERTGVMIVRIWLEDGGDGIRARITETSDIESREQTTHVAASIEQILAIVRDWVESFTTARR